MKPKAAKETGIHRGVKLRVVLNFQDCWYLLVHVVPLCRYTSRACRVRHQLPRTPFTKPQTIKQVRLGKTYAEDALNFGNSFRTRSS